MNCIRPFAEIRDECLLIDSSFLSTCISGGASDLIDLRNHVSRKLERRTCVLLPYHGANMSHWKLFTAAKDHSSWQLQKPDSLSLPDHDKESSKISCVFGK